MVARSLDRSAASSGLRCAGFLNDYEPPGSLINRYCVLGPFAFWHSFPPQTRFIAPLHKAKEMVGRATRIRGLGIPRERWATVIDPQTFMEDDVTYGTAFHAEPYARVMSGARLGDHVSLRCGCHVGHDCNVEDFVLLGTNAVLSGYATVCEGAHIAPGAQVLNGIRIGRYSVIGLGAVVIKDVPDGAIIAGNPARVIGSIELN